jgi:hypothetical protein
VTVEFFTFDVNGRQTGLIRKVEADQQLWYERIDAAGTWIDDPSLVRHFYAEGYDLVAIDESRAAELAERYGGTLEPLPA